MRSLRRELAVADLFRGLEQLVEGIARVPPELVHRPRRQRGPTELRELCRTGFVACGLELGCQPLALRDESFDGRLIQRCHRLVVRHLRIVDISRVMLDARYRMTVSSPSRRLQVIAVAFAVAALAMAGVAIAVVMTRSSTPDTETTTKTEPPPRGPTLVESRVDAADIVKLDDSTRKKLWSTTSGGIRIDDAALRKSFGLEADD